MGCIVNVQSWEKCIRRKNKFQLRLCFSAFHFSELSCQLMMCLVFRPQPPPWLYILAPSSAWKNKTLLVLDLRSKINFKLEKNNLDTPPWINLQKSGSSRQPLRSEKTHPPPKTIQTWQTVRSDSLYELDELLLDKLFFVQASIPVDIESFEDLLGLFKGRLPRLAL